MPRSIVLGNGKMLINYVGMTMKEVFYPHVGSRIQTGPTGHRMLLWCDGHVLSFDDSPWSLRSEYAEDSLVMVATAESASLGLVARIRDAVHFEKNVFVREVTMENHWDCPRSLRAYLLLDSCLLGNDIGDTAMIDPFTEGILHFKESTFMLVNATSAGTGKNQKSTGVRDSGQVCPDPSDIKDGALSEKPVSQGCVYSIIGAYLDLPPRGSATAYIWIVFDSSLRGTRALDQWVKESGPAAIIRSTEEYWRLWLAAAVLPRSDLPPEAISLYKRSLLTVRVECDNEGGILAANDRDMLEKGRDHYSYVWPRDGALVAMSMLRAGYPSVARRFIEFCSRHVTDEGFLWQRYHPDGSLGSTWHPWLEGGEIQPPIQEDETALAIILLDRYMESTRDFEFLSQVYQTYFRMADFLVRFMDEETSMPLPSRDLWEERKGVFTFTIATVVSALDAASRISEKLGLLDRSRMYAKARDKMSSAWAGLFFDSSQGVFARALYSSGDAASLDLVPDSSLHGIWQFGLLPPDDQRVVSTILHVESSLRVNTWVGGIARYRGDYYFKRTDDLGVAPGNPWAVCTLWAASWHAVTAQDTASLDRAKDLILWVTSRANGAGLIAEQYDPFTGKPLSVCPLTWSHAAFVDACLDYSAAFSRLIQTGHLGWES